MAETSAPEGQMTWNDDGFYDVSFAVNKSRRYHAKMRAFYQASHDYATAATAISGTSGFVAVLADASTAAKVLTAIVAVASTLDLVFGFDKKASLHDNLCRRFTDLAAKIEDTKPTLENFHKIREERINIEKDKPTERRLIDLLAQNEECRARGIKDPGDLISLTRAQRYLGYIMTFGMRKIEAQHDKCEDTQ